MGKDTLFEKTRIELTYSMMGRGGNRGEFV
jgi:hypothetical protein